MAESRNWAFSRNLQPSPEDVDFDLDAGLDSVVLLRAEIPEDAYTAAILGTERAGNGVVIRDDGLVLTIGYLITEAESICSPPTAAPSCRDTRSPTTRAAASAW